MKRWAICKLGEYEGEDGGIVPKFNIYTQNSRIWSKQGFNWCFGQFSAPSLTAMQDDPDVYILPDGVMDMSVGSIPLAIRNNMKTKLESAGFVFSAVKTSWTVRQLLNYLAAQLQPGIDVESGDVKDSQ